MQIKSLMDENLPPIYQIQLRRKEPDLVIWAIDHLAQGQHIPGIFQINPSMSLGKTIEELVLAALASLDDEYRDRISYLPLQ
ncbi:hypothetical protein APA_2725 [Pseudanabaena sp. lw0831]|uniref:hypothetical protein n=1 Tax=Pseudanabaena sp. lw0831 TaxID=1357935 RepID=UPI001A20A3B0|nr:hypothetical protein [Pseudanabaena sp. lw0831]GBO54674.1 hypothetical protein APA_2725 [Pseudanabaena sp. lw0831]